MKGPILTLAAMLVCVFAALPTTASAANSLAVSLDKPVPSRGKPFLVTARGNADPQPGGQNQWLEVYLAQATKACAPDRTTEEADATNMGYFHYEVGAGPFEERVTVSSVLAPYGLSNGLTTGRYRLCGYLSESSSPNVATLAATRLDFTVGGTCASSTARVAKADKALKKANKALKRAKRAYNGNPSAKNAKRLKSAKAKVKKAKRKLKAAKSDRKALC